MIYTIFAKLFYLGIIDVILYCIIRSCYRKNNRKAQWFFLHSIGNCLIVHAIFPELMDAFTDPSLLYTKPTTFEGSYWAFALHVYHAVMYTMNSSDLFHHLVFAISGIGYSFYFQPYIVSSVPLLTLTGVPGAIDYFLLANVKLGRVPKLTEKSVNAWLNCWIRVPLSMMIVGMAYVELIKHSRWECIPCVLLVAVNSVYYGNMAVNNYHDTKSTV